VFATEFCEGTLDEVGAIVGDDVVWEAVSVDELADKLGSGLPVTLGDWLGLDPLCEFVDGHEQVGVTHWSLFELANHVESQIPNGHVMGIVLSTELGICVWLAYFWHPSQHLTTSTVSVWAVTQSKPWRMALATSEDAPV
jgi:hypothetical protein